MTYKQLIDHFGSIQKAAKALGYSRMAIYKWRDIGKIPLRVQPFVARVSLGKLKADRK